MTLHTGTRARRCDARRSRERGEWTKFLDIENPHNTATVDAALLDDGASVELKVTAPDRPGLLADLTQAIVRADLTIDQARVTTPGAAKNTFQARGSRSSPPPGGAGRMPASALRPARPSPRRRGPRPTDLTRTDGHRRVQVRRKDGARLDQDAVNSIKAAILHSALSKGMSPLPPPPADKLMGGLLDAVKADTEVECQLYDQPNMKPGYLISFKTTDRPGLLAKIVDAMDKMGLEIYGQGPILWSLPLPTATQNSFSASAVEPCFPVLSAARRSRQGAGLLSIGSRRRLSGVRLSARSSIC